MAGLTNGARACQSTLAVREDARPAQAWALLREGWAHLLSVAQSEICVLDRLPGSPAASHPAQEPLSQCHCSVLIRVAGPVGRLRPWGWSQL